MFDEPQERRDDATPDATERLREKVGSLRMHAELAAIFEGPRKFDAELVPGLDAGFARDLQQTFGKLAKNLNPTYPVLEGEEKEQAESIFARIEAAELAQNDYHIHRRPGEVVLFRWLTGEGVDSFYERFQAHFQAGLEQAREDDRQALGWKDDPSTNKYLEALDDLELRMADRYFRDALKKHIEFFALTTLVADEMNIVYLTEYLMDVTPADLVGRASAPNDPTDESQLGWFFRMFSLRGTCNDKEHMCFFVYMQKSDESFDD